MLGKEPCLLRTSSSRSLLIPCEDTEGGAATFGTYMKVAEKNPRPALHAPCKVVIGFDTGAEKKATFEACESPRSVLDIHLPQEKEHAVARSPRSRLGSLLAGRSGSGNGLEVVAIQNQGKDTVVQVGSGETTFHLLNCLKEACSDEMGLSSELSHVHCKDTSCLGKDAVWDFMDANIPLSQRQAPCVLSVEGRLDAGIAPWQSGALFPSSRQVMNGNVSELNISPYQSRAFDTCLGNGLNGGCCDADIFPQSSQAPWKVRLSHVTHSYVSNYEHARVEVSTLQNATYGPRITGTVDISVNDHNFTWQSTAQSLCDVDCTDTPCPPWQRPASHQMSLDVETEEIKTQQSIFFAASPPGQRSLITSFSGFLKECAFCGLELRVGKDIFMYRGDQAFCSLECRYQRIVLDDCKDCLGI